MTFDVIDDLSTITGIYKYQLDQVADKAQAEICNCVLEAMQSGDNRCVLDIGIGTLVIGIDEDGAEYKFIPSKQLEEKLIKTVETKKSPLQGMLESRVNMRMLNIYKELL